MNKFRTRTELLANLKRGLPILVAPLLLIIFPHCGSTDIVVSGKVRQLDYQDKINYRRVEEILGQSLFSGELSSVFHILDEEVDLSGIPICVYAPAFPRNSSGEKRVYALSYTSKNGSFKLKIPERKIGGITVYANGGEEKSESCGSDHRVKFRDDIKGSQSVFSDDELFYASTDSIGIVLSVTYDGAILTLQREVDNLMNQVSSLTLRELMERSEKIIGHQSTFAAQYPKSSQAMKESIMSVAGQAIQRQADEAFQSRQFATAYALYSELVKYVPSSPLAKRNRERMTRGQLQMQERQAFESMMASVRRVSKTKAVAMLESYLARISSDNPYQSRVRERIAQLRSALKAEQVASSRAKPRPNRRREDDAVALKRFGVDLSITQLDLFMNSLAYRDKYIAMSCAVVKFETATSAIMRGADTFYADFKISPPKKSSLLNIIAKVKGVREYTEEGVRLKIPYVEVVHYLDKMP